MCDMAEEELAEYLLWVEAERVHARSTSSLAAPRTPPAPIRLPPPPREAAEV